MRFRILAVYFGFHSRRVGSSANTTNCGSRLHHTNPESISDPLKETERKSWIVTLSRKHNLHKHHENLIIVVVSLSLTTGLITHLSGLRSYYSLVNTKTNLLQRQLVRAICWFHSQEGILQNRSAFEVFCRFAWVRPELADRSPQSFIQKHQKHSITTRTVIGKK